MSETFDTEVVVAGAGAAGLAAALSASERGRAVTLVEASETFRTGNNTSMSTSMIPAGGSRWQAELGIDDSPARFEADVMRKTGGSADPVVTQALTSVAPELVAWLADYCGVPLELATDFRYPGHSRDRCHTVPDRAGRTLHSRLLDASARHASIDLIVPMSLDDVEVDGDHVVGCTLRTPDGSTEYVRTPAVVLATNGFAANEELVRRYIPEIKDGLYFGGENSMGAALRIGERVGADAACLDAYQGHGSVATGHGILVTWAVIMHGGIMVNALGHRFGDETTGYSEFAVPVLDQPGGTAWMVFDRRIGDLCEPFRDYQDLLESNAISMFADIGSLAERIGCEPEALEATLRAATEAASGGAADEHGRTEWEAPLRPPYAAVKVTGALFHTQGGLRVDGHAQVQRGGKPLKGLYAAGGAAVGMSGNGAAGYLAGNGLLAALGLGFIAGTHLASRELAAVRR